MRRFILISLLVFHCFACFAQGAFEDYKIYQLENNKYAFTDLQGNLIEKLGTWDEIEYFNIYRRQLSDREFVAVWEDSKEYYLDTLGNAYRVAHELSDPPNSKIQALDLYDHKQRFDTFPMEVLQYPNLQVLIIDGHYRDINNFTTLPAEIVQLKALRFLSLRDGSLSTLPDNLDALAQLQTLDLEGNQLATLPESITKLQNLNTLSLGANHLVTLPESLGKLQNLNTLDLSLNRLTTLPESVTKLQNLNTLDLSSNDLTTLPESIAQLKNLERLVLDRNNLSSLPESF